MKEGLKKAGVEGEILIVDSSDDATTEIALAHGARVLKTPRRGLGRAYIDAIPYIRGRWVLMGDADCTYDFRELGPFVERFREGNEYVMGSRWRGSIEPGSMPFLHRYLGTPVTTWILNSALLEQVLGHPLWHARHHARRAPADADPLAVVAVRVGDGPQGGAHGLADRRGSGPLPKGQRGQAQPPQARRLDRSRGRRPGSTCRRCSSTAPTSSCSSRASSSSGSAWCSRCRSAWGR